ncbi:MAG: TerC family protein [Alphaproteobacteria bacterium]|nr:MAG: TerC family protein [Alphaproteobacteria bacterium]
MIDLVLAGDNAVVVGMAAAGLPAHLRKQAILIGIGAAAVLRILFAVMTTQLLAIIGLTFAGGVLLLWVAWKMWREIQEQEAEEHALDDEEASGTPQTKTLGQALWQIVIADVSMSLDNVLAVAGAAREHPTVMVIGLAVSVVLMGVAATIIARLLNQYRWIAFVGLALILYVALKMMWDGGQEILQHAALI